MTKARLKYYADFTLYGAEEKTGKRTHPKINPDPVDDFNVKANSVKLSSTFYRANENGDENQIVVELDLTDEEKVFLVKELDDYCFTATGLSCQDFINETRFDNGLKEIKSTVSIIDKLKHAQKRSTEASAQNTGKNDFDKDL